MGRFLMRDMWGGDANNPQSLNRFVYVENSPVNFSDPTGNYGPSAHYFLVKDLVSSSLYATIIDANSNLDSGIAEIIASHDVFTDARQYGYFFDPAENAKFHFSDLQTARLLMENALMTHDPQIFGVFLHTLQDTYAHDREGYTSTHKADSDSARSRNFLSHRMADFFDGGHTDNGMFIPSPYPAHPKVDVIRDVQIRNPWLNASTLTNGDLIDLYLRYDESDPNKNIRRQERSYFGFETDKYIPYSTRDTLMRGETKMWIDRFLFDYMFNLCIYAGQDK
jgi:hypothetical protein